jgi:CRISPR/Cas system CSM-associated protein Csm3 (group 7 of RAMP superfamily)
VVKKHVNPLQDNKSRAPYNFVPQPEAVLYVEEFFTSKLPWQEQDKFLDNCLTGEIIVEAEALTPLFIRGERKKSKHGWDTKDSRLREDPFRDFYDKPMIPGSSFRGMIRNILEIISFSKLTPVFPDKLFFRSMAADAIGQTYRNIMMKGGSKPQAGYFRRNQESCFIEPCEAIKIPHSAIPDLNYRMHPGYTPNFELQGTEFNYNGHTGKLIITGCAPEKKHEFLFVENENQENQEKIIIPDSYVERFEDDDQISQWQEKAFPVSDDRQKAGGLADGDPVFYLCDNNLSNAENNPSGLIFFGRAQMFRLPYDRSPAEMTDNDDNKLDMAEAIFGTVKRKEAGEIKAVKGRLFFSDLQLAEKSTQSEPVEMEAFVPSILLSPRPTTFQHYLIQTNRAGKDQLRTYLNNNPTDLRGHKLYWHRWDENDGVKRVKDDKSDRLLRNLTDRSTDKIHTIIKPVRKNAIFTGKIKFTNLKKMELGALLSALELPQGCAHKLGMARPLGLGSIKITVKTIKKLDIVQRYQDWSTDGLTNLDGNEYKAAFAGFILKFAKKVEEPQWPDQTGLQSIFRLDAFYRLMSWKNRPDMKDTEYMNLSEFRDRKVLPTPQFVKGIQEQPFKEIIKNLASVEDLTQQTKYPRSENHLLAQPKVRTLSLGKEFEGKFAKVNDAWVAKFEEDARHAKILNSNRLPSNISEEQLAIFIGRE